MKKSVASFSKLMVFIAVCAVLAFLLAAGAVFLHSHNSDDSSSSKQFADGSQSASSSQSGATSAPQAQENSSSVDVTIPTDVVEQALTRTSEVLATPEEAFSPGDSLADTALEGLQATADEWNLLGYRQEGTPVISDVQVLKVGDTGNTMQVLACVDSSDVHILDENGKEVSDEQAPARSRSIFDLEFLDGKWKVTNQSFPEDPEC